jgi:hypothetical protein
VAAARTLTQRKDEILAAGVRLQITLNEHGGTHELQIEGIEKD